MRHQFAGRVGVEDLGGADAGRLVHAHVERRVLRVREAAVGLVQLHGGDAEVEQDTLDARDAEAGQDLRQLVVDGVHEGGAVPVGGQALPRQLQRGRVPVEGDQAGGRERGEQRLAVPSEAERAVDDDRAGLGERGGEHVQTPLEHDGYVAIVAAHAPSDGVGGRWVPRPLAGGMPHVPLGPRPL
ncbi:hypothetical protein SRIMM317S_02577 [Streptomyces rimosus subsp. rimosus]